MTKATAPVDIVNLALGHLKHKAVTSITPPDEGSKGAAAGAKWYDDILRYTLSKHSWNFAIKRVNIAAETTAPEYEYSYKYELPNDYIRTLNIGENWYDEIDYEDEGGYLLTDEAGPLKLRYIFFQEQVTKFSSPFIIAFSLYLGGAMAYEVTGNATLKDILWKQADQVVQEAKSIDGQNRPPRRVTRSPLLEARQNRGRYRDYRRWGND